MTVSTRRSVHYNTIRRPPRSRHIPPVSGPVSKGHGQSRRAASCLQESRVGYKDAVLQKRTQEDSTSQSEAVLGILSPSWPVQIVLVDLKFRKCIIGPEDILSFFWHGGLDSPCLVCGAAFNGQKGPPIRTISLDAEKLGIIGQGEKYFPNFLSFNVNNRHLSCIQEEVIKYIPVSHVWHQAVADAHETQQGTSEAAQLSLEIPLRTLFAAARIYGPKTEIWHDYISVPQWQYSIQQRLLSLLPAIFRTASDCLIHLDDLPQSYFESLSLDKVIEPYDMSLRHVEYSQIRNFFSARWFRRMWVSLEFSDSNQACILTKEFQPPTGLRNPKGSFSFMYNEFWNMTHQISTWGKYPDLLEGTSAVLPWSPPLTLLSKRLNKRSNCAPSLGTVVGVLATKDCRTFRDRFLAICGFLEIKNYETISLQLPRSSADACRWVWLECLRRGDYSPLFLTPANEREIRCASWLVGHEQMTTEMWTLALTVTPAIHLPLVQGTKLSVPMQCVGYLRRVETLECTRGFDKVVYLVVSTGGFNITPQRLLAALDRIYFLPELFGSLENKLTQNNLETFPHLTNQLKLIISRYISAAQSKDKRLEFSQELLEFLRLDQPVRGLRYESFSLMTYSLREGHEHHRPFDTVGIVQCAQCGEEFIFRFGLRAESLVLNSMVYRIPGLGFGSSAPNGVGLVICKRRVIGRMLYGTPACNCHMIEFVEIE